MAYNSVAEPGRAAAALRHALTNQHRLPFLDRYFVVASHAYRGSDFDSAAATYERILERYPYEVRAINNLALVRRDQRRYAAAESLFARAAGSTRRSRTSTSAFTATQLMQGKFAEAERTLALMARRFPDNSVLGTIRSTRGRAAGLARHRARAREKIAAERGDTAELRTPTRRSRGGDGAGPARGGGAALAHPVHGGRRASAQSRLLFGVMQRGYLALRYRRTRRVRSPSSTRRCGEFRSTASPWRPAVRRARALLRRGRPAHTCSRAPRGCRLQRPRARSEAARRSELDARRDRARRGPAGGCGVGVAHRGAVAPLPHLHAAGARACAGGGGDPRAAIAAYERYLSTPWFWRYEPDAVDLGWAMKRLAECASRRATPREQPTRAAGYTNSGGGRTRMCERVEGLRRGTHGPPAPPAHRSNRKPKRKGKPPRMPG